GERGAGVEAAGVEEIRAGAARLERELAEAQGLRLQCEFEEAAAVWLHGVLSGPGLRNCASFGVGSARRGLRGTARLRIISFNANGLRSAASKGFFDWFAGQDADFLCVQETKAQEHQLATP